MAAQWLLTYELLSKNELVFHRLLVLLGFLSSIVVTIVCATVLVLFHPIFPALGPPVQRWWGKAFCASFGIRTKIFHLGRVPTTSGCVLAPNHSSMFDVTVMDSLPIYFRWIAKEQLKKVPFLGWAMRALGTYFVKRDRSAGDLNIMKEVEDGLRQGVKIIIFPEGTRTHTGELLPLKKGAFRIAQNTGVSIIPVGIAGTFDIAPKGKLPTRWGHCVAVCMGQPFKIPAGESIQSWMEHYLKELRLLIEEAQTYLSG